MKHSGCILEFTQFRNDHLQRRFRKACAEASYINMMAVAKQISNAPAPRFWVSEERAYVVVRALDRGLPVLDNMLPLKREMFAEIYCRVCKLRRENPDLFLFDIVMTVVNSPAPKSYLEPRSVVEILNKIRRGCYRT